jgi:Ran GTPase-activating protein (RanGAP) involved in mRNA processing and transport
MKFTEHISEIHLGNNRLTSESINPLLMSIKENSRLLKRIEILDLSYNMISDDAIKKLCDFISDTACELKE